MTSVVYSVEINDSGDPSLYRTVIADDGVTELMRVPTDMAEVRSASPNTLDSYLESLASMLTATAAHLSDADAAPTDETYRTVGATYSALGLFLATFDLNLLPPTGE